MKRLLLALIAIIYSIVVLEAQNKVSMGDTATIYSFSLADALEYATLHNYQNQKTAKDIQIAKKKIWETTAIGLPQISAEGDYKNMLKIPTQLIPGDFMGMPGTFVPVKFGQQHDLSVNITASQLIFSGEYIVGLQASKIFLQLSEQAYSKSVKTIKETLTKSYYLVLIAKETKKILTETGANIDNLLSEIRENNRVGFVSETDVDQLQLTKQNNENTIIAISNQIEISKRLLKYQLGLSFADSLVLTDSLAAFIESLDADQILYKNFEPSNNIDYQLIETREKLALLDMKREKSQFLPQLSAFLSYRKTTYSNDFNNLTEKWFPANILGVKLTIPLFSSGGRIAKVQQKRMEFEKIQNQKIELKEGLLLQVEQARINFINANNSFQNQKINLNLAKKINKNTEIKYKKGMATSSELMMAQNQYLASLSSYYKSLNDLLNARTTLEYLLVNE